MTDKGITEKSMTMHTDPILQQIKRRGQMLDSEIALATGIPMLQIQSTLAGMSARGEIMACSVTRYEDGKAVRAMQCRISGYVPPASPGRKPG
jgi:sulfopyruvate decarboxylase TPP-binding subunit